MIRNLFHRLAKRRESIEGARIDMNDFRGLPFDNKVKNLIRMFELRDWFVQNSPNERIAFKYSSEMATLHHELNYVTSRISYRRFMLVAFLYFGLVLLSDEGYEDWRHKFDPKFSQKTYGSLEDGVTEGG